MQYHPRTAIKGQVIADFIIEFTNMEGQGVGECPRWSIHTDELSNRQAGGVGVVLRSLEGDEVKCMGQLNFPMTNNKVEYEALIAGLALAKAAEVADMVVYCDSQVVISQVNDNYECKGKQMKKYLEQVKK